MILLYLSGIVQIWFMAAATRPESHSRPAAGPGRGLLRAVGHGHGAIGATQAGALASLLSPPGAMAIGAGIAGAVLVTIRLTSPAAFTLEPDDYPGLSTSVS